MFEVLFHGNKMCGVSVVSYRFRYCYRGTMEDNELALCFRLNNAAIIDNNNN